jgi:hypothetical protein
MTESSGGLGGSGPSDADQATVPAHPPTEAAAPHLPTEVASQNLPTEVMPHPETEIAAPHPQTEVAVPYLPTEQAAGSGRPAGIVRHGPGVPVSAPAGQAALTAGEVWRTGRLPEPPRRRRRARRVASGALTVILLAAAGVVLFLRFHHASFRVIGVAITRHVANGCAVDVTGRIATDGPAGTVSYQWLFAPQSQAPQPVSQSVVAGQHAVYVTAAIEGQGHGSVARDVTLQVLGPGTGTASVQVVVGC